jgi:hypothetical protein
MRLHSAHLSLFEAEVLRRDAETTTLRDEDGPSMLQVIGM